MASSVSVENDGFEYRVSVKGKNNYTGESTVVLTLDVQRDVKRPSGTFPLFTDCCRAIGRQSKSSCKGALLIQVNWNPVQELLNTRQILL